MSKTGTFGSSSVPRHLMRGAVGFGSILGGMSLTTRFGSPALWLVPVGIVALRGCPTCWLTGLVETISNGRLKRTCEDGSCTLAPLRLDQSFLARDSEGQKDLAMREPFSGVPHSYGDHRDNTVVQTKVDSQ
jgi:hypothetical protein